MNQTADFEVKSVNSIAVKDKGAVEEEEEEEEEEELDRAIAAVLFNTALSIHEKRYHYYNIITRDLYNTDSRFKPDKFALEIHTDPTAEDKVAARIVKHRRKQQRFKLLRNTLCALAAPSFGAVVAAFLRRCF